MKKTLKVMAMTVAIVMLGAGAAFAGAMEWVHGNFGTNSSGCAQCHVTHAANVASLLKLGSGSNTQSTFCVQCHQYGGGSPYDVDTGRILKTGYNASSYMSGAEAWGNNAGVNDLPSYSGGFRGGYDWHTGSAGTSIGVTGYVYSTSMHGVENYNLGGVQSVTDGDDVLDVGKIPGGTRGATGSFKCGSCHDPHAGGPSPTNPRLLKTRFFGDTSDRLVTFAAGGDVDGNGYLRRESGYGTGWNNWCGGCHDVFAAAGDESGHVKVVHASNPNDKYMHAMGIGVNDTGVTTDMGTGTPLDSSKKLICMSCHRAHGSEAYMSANAGSFVRYDAGYQNTGTSSALLREDNRDVCYNCHGAATKNTYTYYHGTGGVAHP